MDRIVKLNLFAREYIDTYNSAEDAVKSCGQSVVNAPRVRAVCDKKAEKAFGFLWMYEEDWLDLSAKPVLMYKGSHKYRTFDSILTAERIFFINAESILKVCKGERKSAGTYQWTFNIPTNEVIPTISFNNLKDFNELEEEVINDLNLPQTKQETFEKAFINKQLSTIRPIKKPGDYIARGIRHTESSKAVVQLQKEDGAFIAEYQSTYEASLKTGIARASISQACNGKLITAGGFSWKFKKDYINEALEELL